MAREVDNARKKKFEAYPIDCFHVDMAEAIPNQIQRRCGAFYMRQLAKAIGSGARMIYTAMFDEVDEGTAIFKTAPTAGISRESPAFVTLDADECHTASDWYLTIGGQVDRALSARRAPYFPSSLLPSNRVLKNSRIHLFLASKRPICKKQESVNH